MRRDPTEPEKRLWRHLSNSQLGGFKFRRQAVIAPFIVDFLCPAKALVVEGDRETHEAEADWRRDVALEAQGYRVLHFMNAEVMRNMEGVLTAVLEALQDAPDRWPNGRPHPYPYPKGEGLDQGATQSPSPSGEEFGVGSSRKRNARK